MTFHKSVLPQKLGGKQSRVPEVTPQTPVRDRRRSRSLPDSVLTLTDLALGCDRQWEEVRQMLGGSANLRPVVHDSGLGLHPFGSSLCYSPTPGCIFEVLKNGYIASVTLIAATS
jgi:hypothetical protein